MGKWIYVNDKDPYDLVSRKDLENKIQIKKRDFGILSTEFGDAMEEVVNDVAYARNAKWIFVNVNGKNTKRCSNCNEEPLYCNAGSEKYGNLFVPCISKFCPNCGYPMVDETEEEFAYRLAMEDIGKKERNKWIEDEPYCDECPHGSVCCFEMACNTKEVYDKRMKWFDSINNNQDKHIAIVEQR